MRYEFVLDPMAVDDLRRLDANTRTRVRAALEVHLRHEPTNVSRSRIKRLRNLDHPEYRLRVDEFRVLYDVSEDTVTIYGIMLKTQVENWLVTHGVRSSEPAAGNNRALKGGADEDDTVGNK